MNASIIVHEKYTRLENFVYNLLKSFDIGVSGVAIARSVQVTV
jgi:hypothetical protein